jgi:hypothetical protein
VSVETFLSDLLAFVNSKVSFQVQNFTSDWRDGKLLVSFVECLFGVKLGLLASNSAVQNVEIAMEFSQQKFHIPKILSADDLCSDEIDERSVMTYLSYFHDLVKN